MLARKFLKIKKETYRVSYRQLRNRSLEYSECLEPLRKNDIMKMEKVKKEIQKKASEQTCQVQLIIHSSFPSIEQEDNLSPKDQSMSKYDNCGRSPLCWPLGNAKKKKRGWKETSMYFDITPYSPPPGHRIKRQETFC